MRNTVRGALTMLVVQLLAWTRVSAAQQPQSEWCGTDRCGLLVVSPSAAVAETTTGDRRLVSWMFVPHIPALETAPDPSHLEYQRARRLYQRASLAEAVGIPAILGVVFYVSRDPWRRPWRTGVENGLLSVAVTTSLIGPPVEARAADHLSRAAWAFSRPAGPQQSDSSGCTYDRCALRFAYRAWSKTLVQGLDGTPLSSPRDLFTHAGDSVRAHYERYLDLRHHARWTGTFVLASLVGSMAALHSKDETVRGIGLGALVAGYAVGHISLGIVQREHQELESAVWEYNRALAK